MAISSLVQFKVFKKLLFFKLTEGKDVMGSNTLKVGLTPANHVNENNINSAVNKDEKRSKKEKKNKKEKKEKEVKKEQKNNIIQDNKQNYVENSIGGWNNKLKGKPNGIHSEVKVSSPSV